MNPRYETLTSAELEADRDNLSRAVAVLPVAAIEQHGTHLPLGTDAIIADHMVETAIDRLGPATGATFLPTVRVGASDEHERFAGTLSLGTRGMAGVIEAVGHSLAMTGFRRLVVVSAHGGNTPAVEAAALELRRRRAMLCVTASWLRFGVPDGLLPPDELAIGIHGGAVETALMLHFRPDLVRTHAIADHPSLQGQMAAGNRHLRAHGRLGFAWMAEDLNERGVVGDAGLATAAMGAAIAGHQAEGFVELLDEVRAFDLARLR